MVHHDSLLFKRLNLNDIRSIGQRTQSVTIPQQAEDKTKVEMFDDEQQRSPGKILETNFSRGFVSSSRHGAFQVNENSVCSQEDEPM